MFLLDTDVLSQFRKARPHPGILAWAEAHLVAGFAISAVTVAEIVRGAELVRVGDPAKAVDILGWLEEVLAATGVTVVPVGAAEARIWGAMVATPALRNFVAGGGALGGRGRPKTGADLMIAACAITTGRILVTGNVAHMAEIGEFFPLPGVLDPMSPAALRAVYPVRSP